MDFSYPHADTFAEMGNVPNEIAEQIGQGKFTSRQVKYIQKIPWNNSILPEIDIHSAQEILDKSHYGMQDVKKQIIRYIACQKHIGKSYGDVLLLVGPPGVGKTSIAKTIARAMGREFVKIPLAGIHDSGPLSGYDSNYQDPKPGLIIDGIIQTQSLCPLILLDEIDKLGGSTSNGYPEHVLLHILDSDRTMFVDDMIKIPIDLSNIVFIATANNIRDISPILLDRLNLISLKGYTKNEKSHIATAYLIPAMLKEYKLEAHNLCIKDDVVDYLLDIHKNEVGIRSLKRDIQILLETIIMEHYLSGFENTVITMNEYRQLMGIRERTEVKHRNSLKSNNVKYND